MPYFKTNTVNILFIHIPKTGGSSVKKYFFDKYNKYDDNDTLCGFNTNIKDIPINSDHFTLNNMLEFYNDKIHIDNLKIISIVRNPYNRLISNIFYILRCYKNTNTTTYIDSEFNDIILKELTYYLENNFHCDNHYRPQYEFICNKFNKDVTILKFEDLNNEMIKIGFSDFNIKINVNEDIPQETYIQYLNNDSIILINKIYKKDFEIFGYEMINPPSTF
jgi:hypothetical protein